MAKNIVATGLERECEIQLSYAIGVPHPTLIMIDTFGTGKVDNGELSLNTKENHMKGDFGHEFSIRCIHKITDEEYIEALRIYNETIPFEIRTETNEINFWLSKNTENSLCYI